MIGATSFHGKDFVYDINQDGVNKDAIIRFLKHGRATSVLILAIRGQNRLANARLCLPQPSSSPHPLRHA
ncbi:MAG: hypothetical protein GY782_11355 [Gammaproteobacteria bacterium]|nr:hypothetical protein [Gammaproteobacteria bacterium]